VVSEDVPHKVPDADRTCPKCDARDLRPGGAGKVSVVLDYVPGYFRRRQHIRETLACVCGEHIVTAPGPDHSVEGARYGDSFRAFVVTSKCADAIPLYRQAKQIFFIRPLINSRLCRSACWNWWPQPRWWGATVS